MTLEQVCGAFVVLLFLADIFLTVLYARAGTGLLAPHLNRTVWGLLRGVSTIAASYRQNVLSLAGPLIVLCLVGFWALGLTIGTALIVHPELGSAIRPSTGDTPTDFVTALLVAGNSLSIVGSGDFSPHTTGTRILYLVNSLIGASVLSLTLSYMVQVYSGLRERNALALTVDLMSGRTGNAVEMLIRLLPGGESGNAASELGNLSRSLAATKEAHHFYPLLFYFRFNEPMYSVSRLSFILLDLTTLIRVVLDRRQYENLANSAAVASLHQGALLLLETLDRNFPTSGDRSVQPSELDLERQKCLAAIQSLKRSGIEVQQDSSDEYAASVLEWKGLARSVGPTLGYAMEDIDRRQAEPRAENHSRSLAQKAAQADPVTS
jgi:biotin operon repressor